MSRDRVQRHRQSQLSTGCRSSCRRDNHIAFAAAEVDAMRKRAQSEGVRFGEMPRKDDTQFVRHDRGSVRAEVNFLQS